MSPLHIVFCCLAIYNVTEGRIVRGIIGRNVSFSLTINNTRDDIILIQHNASNLFMVWPDNNNLVKIEQPNRVVRVVVNNQAASNTVMMTVTILNITTNDVGMYSAVTQWNSTGIKDSVFLETIDETLIPTIAIVRNHNLDSTLVLECRLSSTSTGNILWRLNGSLVENHSRYFQNDTFLYIRNLTAVDKFNLYKCKESGSELESDPYSIQIYNDHYTTKTTSLIEDTEESIHYTTTVSRKEDTEGIYNYTTAAITPKVDAEGGPSENHLLYIVLGMGAVLVAVFLACLLHKIRICQPVENKKDPDLLTSHFYNAAEAYSLRVDRGSNTNANSNNAVGNENLQDVNQSVYYWTILSNAEGELCTAIETDVEVLREPLLLGPNVVPTNSESEDSMRPDDIKVIQELGYLNPVNSSTVELDDYIHPIHSCPLNTMSTSIQFTQIL